MRIKRYSASFLAVLMVLLTVPWYSFAHEETTATRFEVGKTYRVPLVRLDRDGYEMDWENRDENHRSDHTIGEDAITDYAIIRKKENGKFETTIELRNYEAYDGFQLYRQSYTNSLGSPDDIEPGTFGINETMHLNPNDPEFREKYHRYDSKVTLSTILEEEKNINIYTDVQKTTARDGRARFKVELDNPENPLFFVAVTTSGLWEITPGEWLDKNSQEFFKEYMEKHCIVKGSLKFDVENAEIMPDRETLMNGEKLGYAVDGVILNKSEQGTMSFNNPEEEIWEGQSSEIDKKRLESFITSAERVDGNRVKFTLDESFEASLAEELSEFVAVSELEDMGDKIQRLFRILRFPYRIDNQLYTKVDPDNEFSRYAEFFAIPKPSDNLLTDNSFVLDFSDDDSYYWGKLFRVVGKYQGVEAYFEFSIRPAAAKEDEVRGENLRFESNGISFETTADNMRDGSVLDAQVLTSGDVYTSVKKLMSGYSGKEKVYSVRLSAEEENVEPNSPVQVNVDIPEDWKKEDVVLYRAYDDPTQGYILEPVQEQSLSGNKIVYNTNKINGLLILSEKNEPINLKSINLENGVYKVKMAFWNAVIPDQISMSNAAVDPEGSILVANDGRYTLYMKLQGIRIKDRNGYVKNMYSKYMGENADKKKTELPYIGYATNADETSVYDLDEYAKQGGYAYPNYFVYEIPERYIKKNDIEVDFYVPIMAELSGKSPADVVNPIEEGLTKQAKIKLYDPEKIEEGQAPTYQLSWLLKSANDFEKLSNIAEDINGLFDEDTIDTINMFKNAGVGRLAEIKESGDTSSVKALSDMLDTARSNAITENLNKQIERAEAIEQGDYSSQSYGKMRSALESAKAEQSSETGNTDKKLDALIKLYTAVESLSSVEIADKQALGEKIQEVNGLLERTEDYTSKSLNELKKARDIAQGVYDDEQASQDEVDEQVTALNGAVEALVEQSDKEQLRKKYEEAKALYDEGNTGDKYPAASWRELEDAIKEAEAVLADQDATESQISKSQTRLFNAVNGLSVTLDKSSLNSLLDMAKSTDTSGIRSVSVELLNAAIASAEETLAKEDANQVEIDKQYLALSSALGALIEESSAGIFNGKYRVFARLWQATSDVPENWKEDEATGSSLGDPALNREAIVEIRDGKPTIEIEFKQRSMMLFGAMKKGYLKSLSFYPEYTGEDFPASENPAPAEIIDYHENEDGERISDEFGTDYPKHLRLTYGFAMNSLATNYLWVKVNVPIMDSISTGAGTQPAKLVIDWDGREQIEGIDTDKAQLINEIKLAKELDRNGLSEKKLSLIDKAIALGENVRDDLNVSQEIVDAAKKAVENARLSISDVHQGDVDKSNLRESLKKADSLIAKGAATYTAETFDLLVSYRDHGKTVLNNENATQSEVNVAQINIENAITGLIALSDKEALQEAVERAKVLLKKTSMYSGAALDALEIMKERGENLIEDKGADQKEIDKTVSGLNYIIDNLKEIDNSNVYKDGLIKLFNAGAGLSSRNDIYSKASLEKLKEALRLGRTVYDNRSATQREVNEAASKIADAIMDLSTDRRGGGSFDESSETNSNLNPASLADGMYSVRGTMVKVDRSSLSMSNDAINHNIKLTVKNGKYAVTMDFKGLTVSGKLGYLGKLEYYLSGYGKDRYGNPTGERSTATVDSVQKYSNGTAVRDSYGTNYPDLVSFPLIEEAKSDGFVPLRVTVPLMEALNAGQHNVYLKLDWATLKAENDNGAFADNSTNDVVAPSAKVNDSDTIGLKPISVPNALALGPANGSAVGKSAPAGLGLRKLPALNKSSLSKPPKPELLKSKDDKKGANPSLSKEKKADGESSGASKAAAGIGIGMLAAAGGLAYKLRGGKLFG